MLFNNIKYYHLSYWEKKCAIDQMEKWCGNHQIEWKSEIRNRIKNSDYKTILDCGAGVFSEYFGFKKDNYDISYTATEITKKFIKFGMRNGIKVDNFPINRLGYENNMFDCVICYDVLNHQVDYKKGIEELVRVFKKELIISFFKPFEEDDDFQLSLGDAFPYYASELGTIQKRYVNIFNQATLIYHYFSKRKLIDYLKTLNVSFQFDNIFGKNILFITK